jgi:putative intracellular protease/amidase
MQTEPFVIVFALYEGVTQLDFTGPHQFLSRLPGATTRIACLKGGDITAEGLTFSGLEKLEAIERCDLLCVPGGVTAADTGLDRAFVGEIARLAQGARYVTSVCTGSLILGAAGLIRGRKVACHWAWRHLLEPFGAIPDPGRVVKDGRLITGGGVTAGIDFALTVIAEIAGPETAMALQLGLEYAPAPPFDAGSPETAPPAVLERYRKAMDPLMARREAAVREAARRLAPHDQT